MPLILRVLPMVLTWKLQGMLLLLGEGTGGLKGKNSIILTSTAMREKLKEYPMPRGYLGGGTIKE